MNTLQAELSASQLARLQDSSLFNADLAPVPLAGRKWGMLSFAALWISMSACIPTYMLASSLIGGGMNWWQAVLTIFLGNRHRAHSDDFERARRHALRNSVSRFIAARRSAREAPMCRPLLRALVACGWFGIQTWIGGEAIYKILACSFPRCAGRRRQLASASRWPQFLCFLFFWGINMCVIYSGIDSIRLLLNIKAPLLIALGLLLLAWAYRAAGGFGPILVPAVGLRRRASPRADNSGASSSRRSPAWSAFGRRSR